MMTMRSSVGVAVVLAVALGVLPGATHGCDFYCTQSFWGPDYRVEVGLDNGKGGIVNTPPNFGSMAECNAHLCDCWSATPTLSQCSVLRGWANFKADASCAVKVRSTPRDARGRAGRGSGTEQSVLHRLGSAVPPVAC